MDFESLNEIYSTDENKAVNGVSIDLGINRNGDPMGVIVAEIGNPLNEKTMRKYERALESTRHNKKKRRLIWAKILAESILKGWYGMLGKEDGEIQPTLENKIAALTQYEKFFVEVMDICQNHDLFRPDTDGEAIDVEEESEKNLENTSDGTTGMEAS